MNPHLKYVKKIDIVDVAKDSRLLPNCLQGEAAML